MSRQILLKSRKENTKQLRKIILIVCEGSKTEPLYFKSFAINASVITIEGLGDNTLSLVKQAIRLSELTEYNEVWCVFDRDSFPKHQVNEAIKLAEEKRFNVALSNEAFELWYLLHFCYLDTKLNRNQYCEKLTQFSGSLYKKNDPLFYSTIKDKQSFAIKNAKRLAANLTSQEWSECCPYTGVYKLVERLNKLKSRKPQLQ